MLAWRSNEHLDPGHSIRASLFLKEHMVHARGGFLGGDWNRSEHLHLQRCQCLALPASALRRPRPASDPVESFAWPEHRARLVLYGTVLRYQDESPWAGT